MLCVCTSLRACVYVFCFFYFGEGIVRGDSPFEIEPGLREL